MTAAPMSASRRPRTASASLSDANASNNNNNSSSSRKYADGDDALVRVKTVVAPQPQAVSLCGTLLAGAALWLLFAVTFDPPFAAYWLLANALVRFVAANRLAKRNDAVAKRRVIGLALLAVVGSTALLALLREFELNDLEHYAAAPITLTGGAGADADGDESRPRVHFLRLHNPQVGYLDDIETIHRSMNSKAVVEGGESNKPEPKLRVQRYTVHTKLNPWSSDVLRYNILLQFWSQMDAQRQDQQRLRRETADSNQAEILCVVETDVVFREAYFADTLRSYQEQREITQQSLELAHIQHFWGHHTLEPFNIGVLCTSSRASLRTRLWVRLMSALHAKRYRRLLHFDALFAFLPDRFVFAWDQHHGCTDYYPHCHYVHFTRPKSEGIQKALKAIAREEKAVS